jgi:pentatricopeptide repeat protein
VITYNTLLKGYAKRGDVDECFKLYELMRSRGVAASQVTYGILLDGCINNNQVDKASMVFNLLKADGCPMNTVLYTTLIKGLAREQKVDEAMEIFKQMQNEKDIKPDLITFSILLRANFDVGRLEVGLGLVELMLKMGVQPDGVIFNNMLAGCAKFGGKSSVVLARRIYADMGASGLRPSTATFSILIRIFSDASLLEEAHEMLRTEPKSYNMEVEPRLFLQLIHACINQRQGRRAIDVYKLMHEHCRPSAAAHTSVLGMCVKLNMFDTAADILAVAMTKDACVDARDANAVLEGALRKKRDGPAESCAASMRALGLKVDASPAARLA